MRVITASPLFPDSSQLISGFREDLTKATEERDELKLKHVLLQREYLTMKKELSAKQSLVQDVPNKSIELDRLTAENLTLTNKTKVLESQFNIKSKQVQAKHVLELKTLQKRINVLESSHKNSEELNKKYQIELEMKSTNSISEAEKVV